MRILARVDDYAHAVRAGSEVTMHQQLRWLVRAGHEVEVYAGGYAAKVYSGEELDLEGVTVRTLFTRDAVMAAYDAADVVVTQQAMTRKCLEECAGRVPVVFFAHAAGQLEAYRVDPGDLALVVFNSLWMTQASRALCPTAVVHPTVFLEDYETEENEGRGGILQINLSELKGGPLFWWLARHLGYRRFLAGTGTWGIQSIPAVPPANVTVLPTVVDPRDHYQLATVVIMPSKKESYGRVALEAACSGIPAVLSPTPGLLEAVGRENALWADPGRPEEWAAALKSLEDPEVYALYSERAMVRAEKADARSRFEMAALEDALAQVASHRRGRVWAFASETHYVDHAWPYLACVKPWDRGPLVVPELPGADPWPALERAYRAGAVTLRLPEVRGKKHLNAVLDGMGRPDFPGSACVVVSQRDRMAAEEWFPGRVVRGEHGAGQSYQGLDHHSFPGGPGHAGCLAATAPGPVAQERIRRTHRALVVAPVGCPRLLAMEQTLQALPDQRERLLVLSFRYPGTESHCQELGSTWKHYGRVEAPEGWRVGVHLHPRARGGEVEQAARAFGWEVIPEFWDVVRRAAVFAVDNSSAAVEWHYLRGGNLVLLDCPEYRRWVEHGLRFWAMQDWPGVTRCSGPEGILAAVQMACESSLDDGDAHPWFSRPDPARLSYWLTEMLRPVDAATRIVALVTFEGHYGRIVANRSAWVPETYAREVITKGLAVRARLRATPEETPLPAPLPRTDADGGESLLRWTEARTWTET